MPQEYEVKIAQLREKYTGSPESLEDINEYEKSLLALIKKKKLLTNPAFEQILAAQNQRLNEINAILMNDETLIDSARDNLYGRRTELRFLLSRLGATLEDNAIKLLLSTIDQKLEQ